MKKTERLILSRAGLGILIVSGVLTAAICLVMNLYLIPEIEREAGGLRCFDMRFWYTAEDARAFLQALGAEGRVVYLERQLPLDLAYPVCYCCFFVCALARLRKKADAFALLPLLLAGFDYAENACVIRMLRAASFDPRTAVAGSVCTTAKTLLMYAVFLLLVVFLIRALLGRKRKKAESPA